MRFGFVLLLLACAGALSADVSTNTFRFVTNDLNVVDGRPVFLPDGKTILFMRQPNDGNPASISTLYTVPADGSADAQLFFDGINPNTNQPFNATRPDYSWERSSFQIAFDALGDGIWLLDADTKAVKQVLQPEIHGNRYTWSYPAWYPCGHVLSVTNYNSFGQPLYHALVRACADQLNQFVPLTTNHTVWPGMSTVSQKHPCQIAFAGEMPIPQPPPACTCPGGCSSDGYAQNCNQIWMQVNGTAFQIDQEQGRAPWFSPDGKRIVFESNRLNPETPDLYRLFVYTIKDETVEVITPPALNVQHAKWSPDGKKLAFAVQLHGGAQGIAVVTLS